MDSPFPGMDPYLERHWADVHQALVTYSRDQIQARLPADLRARMGERLVIAIPEERARVFVPDVRVVEDPAWRAREGQGEVAVLDGPEVAVATPLVLVAEGPRREGFIEIIESAGERVVTVIEVLSPANKQPGRDLDQYLRKRDHLAQAGISLVEVDLLRGGRRVPIVPEGQIPETHRTPYAVTVRRGWGPDAPNAIELYRAPLRERLPGIRVPLREADRDVPLDLQAVIAQAYRNGRYHQLDYRGKPDPPLDSADAAWADALLREKGRR